MAELCTLYDSGAKLFAYLDDWYLWIKPQCHLQTIAVITAATRSVNLALQSAKTQVWKRLLPRQHSTGVPRQGSRSHLVVWEDIYKSMEILSPAPVVLGEQATMEKTTQRFKKIATTLADLNAEGLNVQTVNDLLTMYVGAASQHVLRMSFASEQEAQNFDRQVLTFWSRLMHRDITSPLFFLPLKLGGLGVGSAVQRHAAAPWRAWQSIIPSLMSTTQSPDTDSLFSSTPLLRAQLTQLQSTLSQQMNKPTFQLKPLGAALHLQTTQKKQVSTNIHRQFYKSLTDTPTEQAILLSQSTSHTGGHLMQPRSETYEIEDRCFRVSVARRLMLPHPAAANHADVVQFCPNKSAAGVICNKPLDPKQHHCYGCRYGGGVDRRHAAMARCLADIIHSHSGVKVFIEQEVPALTRVVNGQTEHARMDLVFNLDGSITYLDVSIVAPFSCNPSLVSAASTKPGLWPKEWKRTNLTGIHTSTSFLSSSRPQVGLAHMPGNSLATSCEMLTTHQLRSETLGPPSKVFFTVPSPNNNSRQPLRDSCGLLSHPVVLNIWYLWLPVPSHRNAHCLFQSQSRCSCAMWPCCDITSSDDDEHNTDSSFLLLFADVGTTPTLLEGLTEVDILHVALGCRFALDIFTISQQYSPTPDHEPLPHDPEFATF